MANFQINNLLATTPALQAVSATYKTMIGVNAITATLRRIKIYDLMLGTAGTPADNYMEADIARMTAAGTATTSVPVALDPADPAGATAGFINYTAEPTVTANSTVFYIPFNQRASYRWVAAPGSELVGPATNAAGFALRARSAAYTGNFGATAFFQEQ